MNSSVEIGGVIHLVVNCSEAHSSLVKHRAAHFHGFGLMGVGYGQFELLKVQGFTVIRTQRNPHAFGCYCSSI